MNSAYLCLESIDGDLEYWYYYILEGYSMMYVKSKLSKKSMLKYPWDYKLGLL